MTISNPSASANVAVKNTKTVSGTENGTSQTTSNNTWSPTVGTATNQANVVYTDTLTISGSSSETIDLSALSDAYGDSITLARIKALLIVNKSSANSITVGNATAPWEGWISAAGTITIPASTSLANGVLNIFTPDATAWPVTAVTADELKITNDGATSTIVEVVILGASA